MEKIRRSLGVRSRLKDCSFVIGQNFEPRGNIAGVIVSRLEFRRDVEVGAQEAASEFGDQLFSSALGSVFRVAAQIPVELLRSCGPMH